MNLSLEGALGAVRLSAPRGLLGVALWLTPGVALLLVVVKSVWHVPGELMASLGLSFLICGIPLFLADRATKLSTGGSVVGWLLVWIVMSTVGFGIVYQVDRAGWLWFQLSGYDLVVAEAFPDARELDRDGFLELHPRFLADGTHGVRLGVGVHDLTETLVIPRGVSLTIDSGAVLRFGAGRSLVSYGPLRILGTPERPVGFEARWPWLKWGVVAVVDADRSTIAYARFEDGRRAHVNGTDLPGALSLVNADVDIHDSEFVNLFGKDAVYVRGGDVRIQNNLFQNIHKDGLDLNGSTGEVSGNRFVDCLDEGIDLDEATRALVVDNVVLDSLGGRIAAETGLAELRARNQLGYSEGTAP